MYSKSNSTIPRLVCLAVHGPRRQLDLREIGYPDDYRFRMKMVFAFLRHLWQITAKKVEYKIENYLHDRWIGIGKNNRE
jgi:hypothetical protein